VDSSNPLNPGNFKKVKFIPDGALAFTRAFGATTLWANNRGFGERSWRYSVVINDLKIEKLFVEVSFLLSFLLSQRVTNFGCTGWWDFAGFWA